MKLIIGLGNPGTTYDGTRHNVGFAAVDRLVADAEGSWKVAAKRHAFVAKVSIEGEDVIAAKPSTFMNESGRAVQALLSYYKVAPKDLLVIHDEMDIAPGRIAFLAKGGPAGHNGVLDIQSVLGTKELSRLRIGVGRPTSAEAKESWVLGKPSKDERAAVKEGVDKAAQAATDWTRDGLTKAMNRWNTK